MSSMAGRDCVREKCPFLQFCLIGLLEGEEFHRWHTCRHSIRCKNCGAAWHMGKWALGVKLNFVAVIDRRLNPECGKAYSGAYWRDSWLPQCPACDRGKTYYWLVSRAVSASGVEATCSGASYVRYEPQVR